MNRHDNSLVLLAKIGYVVIVGFGIYLAFSHHVYDDPFITYRYAENLSKGLGFVYNAGERVLSTTTPLFTLILAALQNLWPDLQSLANFIGAFSIALSGLLIWEIGQTWNTPLVGWSGLLLYPTFPLILNTLGSETPLFLALCLGGIALYAKNNLGGAVVLLSLGILTRSDGVLIAGVLGMHFLWTNNTKIGSLEFWKKQPWGWIGVASGLLILWHGFAWFYFGAPLPVTMAAKQAQGRMAISQLFAPGMLRVAGWYSKGWHNWIELVLFIMGVIFAFLNKQRWRLILVWTGLYFLAYSILGVTGYFWYYAPLVPGWVVGIGLGFSLLIWLPSPGRLRISPLWNRIRPTLVGILLAVLFVVQLTNLYQMSQRIDPRYAIYRAAGEWLAENTPVNASVGVLETGIIGYYAQRPMVDFAGLIQPGVADLMQRDTTYNDTAVWAVQKYQPQYLALIAGSLPHLKAKIVDQSCHLVKQFKGSQYEFYSNMQIYACQYD